MLSYLKKENEEEGKSSLPVSDIVTLLVIAVVVIGGYLWYQSEKSSKQQDLSAAEALFQAHKFEEAHQRFCELNEQCPLPSHGIRSLLSPILGNYGVSDKDLDKQIFQRYEFLDSIANYQQEHFDKAEKAVKAGDVHAFVTEANSFNSLLFLDANEKTKVLEWRKQLGLAPLN